MMSVQTGFIQPIKEWNPIGDITGLEGQREGSESGSKLFKEVLGNAINQVTETQKDVEQKQYLLATGQLDDVHTLPIAEAKAALSVDVLISLRNKTMEAYNELMKLSV